ncbi:MAG TPA: hypothetical protein VIJ38_16070 [Acidobacteriaceae bacterium]
MAWQQRHFIVYEKEFGLPIWQRGDHNSCHRGETVNPGGVIEGSPASLNRTAQGRSNEPDLSFKKITKTEVIPKRTPCANLRNDR